MALPTIVCVSEDGFSHEGVKRRILCFRSNATETILKTIIPASLSGILAAVILGIMRAVGETMVVWMALEMLQNGLPL